MVSEVLRHLRRILPDAQQEATIVQFMLTIESHIVEVKKFGYNLLQHSLYGCD